MKNYVFHCLLLVAVSLTALSSCKKDKLEVDAEKYFRQVNGQPGQGLGDDQSIDLSLKPKGVAIIRPGSDIMYPATYRIRGEKLIVQLKELSQKFEFTIVSSTELRGSNGEILLLQ